MLTLIILIILVLLLFGAWPHGPWYGTQGAAWGYGPMGGIGLILILLLIFLLATGRPLYGPW